MIIRIYVFSRESGNTHTSSKLAGQPHEMRNTTAMPCSKSIAIRILCVSSRKKMKWKSLKVTTYFIIFLFNTPTLASLNPKIQKIIVLIV
jgi:hypothetical protein